VVCGLKHSFLFRLLPPGEAGKGKGFGKVTGREGTHRSREKEKKRREKGKVAHPSTAQLFCLFCYLPFLSLLCTRKERKKEKRRERPLAKRKRKGGS